MKTMLRLTMMLGVVVLAGCSGGAGHTATDGHDHGAETATNEPALAPGEMKLEVTDAGFVPAVLEVPKGQAVTLVVTRKVETCATEMIFAGTTDKHDLPLNQTVRVELPADRADTLNYACAMDMIKGTVTIE